ncbi:hypothetical protein B7494_g1299 [Chlorociboria aeruginascens]|nr:hypothetical protein B7494_g1299 [Chlorociboria aeruginascens]
MSNYYNVSWAQHMEIQRRREIAQQMQWQERRRWEIEQNEIQRQEKERLERERLERLERERLERLERERLERLERERLEQRERDLKTIRHYLADAQTVLRTPYPTALQQGSSGWIYRELSELGRGTFARVISAQILNPKIPIHHTSNNVVAVKQFVAARRMSYDEGVEAVRSAYAKEVENIKGLSHQYINPIFGWQYSERPMIFSMKQATDLNKFIRTNPLRQGSELGCLVYEVVVKGLSALQYLQSQRIIIRDIKPPNILIARTDKSPYGILLTDFGVACQVGDPTDTAVAGTKGYVAPEVYLGYHQTPAVDV